jgi:hypothetical protein
MTPRQSASVHLPQLVEDWPALGATFGPVTLEHLVTPDGEWGSDPTSGWPRLVDPQPLPDWHSRTTSNPTGGHRERNKGRARKVQAPTP